MHGLILRWLVNALALILTATIVNGIRVEGFLPALYAALVLGIINAVIRPMFIIFTLPINILTLGGFTLVINAIMLLITDSVVQGFEVKGFWAAFIGSILLAIFSSIINALVKDKD